MKLRMDFGITPGFWHTVVLRGWQQRVPITRRHHEINPRQYHFPARSARYPAQQAGHRTRRRRDTRRNDRKTQRGIAQFLFKPAEQNIPSLGWPKQFFGPQLLLISGQDDLNLPERTPPVFGKVRLDVSIRKLIQPNLFDFELVDHIGKLARQPERFSGRNRLPLGSVLQDQFREQHDAGGRTDGRPDRIIM